VRAHLLGFIDRLRRDGGRVSVAESLDAMEAVAAVGVEREPMREALAATLVKEEADRAGFDRRFDEWFPLLPPAGAPGRRRRKAAGASPAATGSGMGAAGDGNRGSPTQPAEDPAGAPRERRPGVAAGLDRVSRRSASPSPGGAPSARLTQRPIREFTAHDVQEARALVERLGVQLRTRWARRTRRAKRGSLHVRRTLRQATATGGVPLTLSFQRRKPAPPDVLALCDASGSVAAASDLLLGLIAPAADYFRHVHCFAYVDHLCAVSIERGHVAPAGPLDLYARSDFGHVLTELCRDHAPLLTRHTVVVVLGDARNNRRPPRPDLLRAVRDRTRGLYWVIPEAPARWDTGDSVLRLYAPHCDAVLPGETIDELAAAVRRLA
jgi:uncharacterized protein